MELNKEMMINAGGKLWAKNNVERVYLNDKSIVELFGFKLMNNPKWADEFSGIGKSKVWFDAKKNTLHSDKGGIRAFFNQNNIKCVK